jgi:hypothetical protein
MPTNDLPRMFLDTVKEHIPPGAEWMPLAAAAVVALIGLVFMVKGARLAPVLAALVFALVGGLAGPFLAAALGTPLWPSVAGCIAVGLLLGIILFRIWFALLVAVCLALISLAVYGGQVLRGPLDDYLSAGLDREKQLVTLPEAGSPIAPSADWQKEATGLWAYLGEHVPNFQTSVWAIVASTALAGFIFGLLLPKLARAFWAASLGTALLALAVGTAVQFQWPDRMPWLQREGLIVAAALWVLSLAYNWVDVHGVGLKKPAKGAAPKAAT